MTEAIVRWTDNNWTTWNEAPTKDTGLGIYIADISFSNSKSNVRFTFFWEKANHWENKDFEIGIEDE